MLPTKRLALAAALLVAPITQAQTPELADPEPTAVEPAVVQPAPSVGAPPVEMVDPAPAPMSAAVCCPIEVKDVRTKLSARRLYRCHGPGTELTMCLNNPVDCCDYSVPFCVPCCCVGEARVCPPYAGILPGRCKVDVVWDCGFVATVTFLKHGGAIITYSAG